MKNLPPQECRHRLKQTVQAVTEAYGLLEHDHTSLSQYVETCRRVRSLLHPFVDATPTLSVRYGIGIEKSASEFGMTHGPFDSVSECLNIWSDDPRSRILELSNEDDRVIYKCVLNSEQCWEKISL